MFLMEVSIIHPSERFVVALFLAALLLAALIRLVIVDGVVGKPNIRLIAAATR